MKDQHKKQLKNPLDKVLVSNESNGFHYERMVNG